MARTWRSSASPVKRRVRVRAPARRERKCERSAGVPTLDICEIRDFGGWKIDIPNNRTAQQIHDDLGKHLDMISDSSTWSADAKQARRDIARHVLMAIYGVEMMPGSARGRARGDARSRTARSRTRAHPRPTPAPQ